MKALIVAEVLLSLTLVTIASAAPGDTRVYCQRQGSGSYSSEAYCVEREAKAYNDLAARGPVEQRILDYCNNMSDNWSSLRYCIEREEAAKRRLGR